MIDHRKRYQVNVRTSAESSGAQRPVCNAFAIEQKFHIGIWHFFDLLLPERLSLFIQGADAKILETLLKIVIGAVPDHDASNLARLFKIDLPPGIL